MGDASLSIPVFGTGTPLESLHRLKLDGPGLVHNLGKNASLVAGGIAGAKAGAAFGTLAGPVGTAAGGLVGGMIGCVVASEMYETALSVGAEGARILADKATERANAAVDVVTEGIPEAVDNVKSAFNNFFANTSIPPSY